MRSVALVNQKGGVGKSATTKELGATLADEGDRVLLIDLDPQGHLTKAVKLAPTTPPATLASALVGTWTGDMRRLVTGYRPRLDIITTNMDMFLVEAQLYPERAREYRLARVLERLRGDYDWCLIDCPPSLGVLTDNALIAAGAVLIPVQSEDSSLDALELLLKQVSSLEAAMQTQVQLLGLVVNMYDSRRGRVVTSTLEQFQQLPGVEVLEVIRDLTAVREAWRGGVPVIEHAANSDAADHFRTLAKRLREVAQ